MNKIKKIVIILIVVLAILICSIGILSTRKKVEEERLPEEIEEIQPKEVIEIPKNEYNQFVLNNVTEDQKPVYILNNFKEKMLYNAEDAYNCLETKYREIKFGSLENFKKYIDDNRIEIQNLSVYSYQEKNKGSYTRYIIKTEDEKELIFNETNIMEYTALMDSYVELLPETLEKYDSVTERQKVALQIDRFVKAINDKSYYYAYSCLADSFKYNYFKTQEEFENYIKSNFFENNDVTYNVFEVKGEYYTYVVIIKNKYTNETMKKTFIVDLQEGTDFKLSFNI